jgi:hypothetical protein
MYASPLRIVSLAVLALVGSAAAADAFSPVRKLNKPVRVAAAKVAPVTLPLSSRPVQFTPANPVRLINVDDPLAPTPAAAIQSAAPTPTTRPAATGIVPPSNAAIPPAKASAFVCLAGCN